MGNLLQGRADGRQQGLGIPGRHTGDKGRSSSQTELMPPTGGGIRHRWEGDNVWWGLGHGISPFPLPLPIPSAPWLPLVGVG